MHIKTCVDRTCYVPTVPLILNFCLLYVAHPLVLLGLTMSPIMLCSIVVSLTSSVRKLLGCPFTSATIGSVTKPLNVHSETCLIRGGTNKSLAWPGRKQATATKLGIYSSYSPRSSIHFLACCSNFCKPLKKKNQNVVRPNWSPRQQWPPRRTKKATFQLFFQSREQVIVRQGQIRRIGWVIKTLKVQVGQFLLGCKCSVNRGIVVQEQDTLGDLPAAFFLQNVLKLHQQK